jgi:hypothetical protein
MKGRIRTSDKQVRANRRNALNSTGPKTPEEKAAIRLNAWMHGLLSREVLLPRKDEQALNVLNENLRAELQPVGELENLLVTVLSLPTGGYAASGGWRPEYPPGSTTRSCSNGPRKKPATTNKIGTSIAS